MRCRDSSLWAWLIVGSAVWGWATRPTFAVAGCVLTGAGAFALLATGHLFWSAFLGWATWRCWRKYA